MEDDGSYRHRNINRPDRGVRPIAAVVPTVSRDAFKRVSPSLAQLVEAWAGIVGPSLADTTIPRSLVQGTLTLGCNGPVAMELQHLSTELLARINQYLGGQTVRRLRFAQTMNISTSPRPIPRENPSVELAASKAVTDLPEGPLRDALFGLGRAVLARAASRPPRRG